MGYTNIALEEEQRLPEGNFPTCPNPNPEIKEAMALGMEYAVKSKEEYVLLSGNDVELLLLTSTHSE